MKFQDILLFMPVLLFSVIAHEVAHGYAALKQGDDTAQSLGRLTWNPIKHIDPFMTILLPVMLAIAHLPILGGAKPVPVDPRKYRELRKGDIIVSLAGVFTNLLISIGCVILLALFGLVGRFVPALDPSMGILQAMMYLGVQLNLILIAFNLIPIPPLDGSHVMKYLMPASWAYRYTQISRFGILALLAVMYLAPNALNVWLDPALKVGSVMISTVQGTVLPSTAQWLPQ
ncbi:MAG TPA: site-2 protease family protein [Gemmatimonadaceae bacterium]